MGGDLVMVMDHFRGGAANQFFPAVTEVPPGGGIEIQDGAGDIGGDDQMIDGFQETVLDFAQIGGTDSLHRRSGAGRGHPNDGALVGHVRPRMDRGAWGRRHMGLLFLRLMERGLRVSCFGANYTTLTSRYLTLAAAGPH